MSGSRRTAISSLGDALTQRYEECIKMNKKNRSVLRKQELEQDVGIWVGQCFGMFWPTLANSQWLHKNKLETRISTCSIYLNKSEYCPATSRPGSPGRCFVNWFNLWIIAAWPRIRRQMQIWMLNFGVWWSDIVILSSLSKLSLI